jgi:large subunit ribosomal protein L31
MKKDIHPKNDRLVLFVDNSCGAQFLVRSTVPTKEVAVYEGDKKEYPVFYVEISSSSHPFYTGQEKVLDTAGRVDRFNKKRAAATALKK